MKLKKSIGEKIFDVANYVFMALIILIMVYPLWYVLMASMSDAVELYRGGKIILWPRGFNLSNYTSVFHNRMIWIGYGNTFIYVILGTLFSVFLTITSAFVLAQKNLPFKKGILMFIVFTMYFSGGMIPTYMVVKGTKLLDSWLAMVIPFAINTYNLIITLSFFRSLPEGLSEAARIDGVSDYGLLFKIILPLSKAIVAVITLYYMVAKWNDFMTPLLYITNRNLYPLQIVLREILIGGDNAAMVGSSADSQTFSETIKYATIIVSTVPILCVYPFIQKYFIKGVMIGAIKG